MPVKKPLLVIEVFAGFSGFSGVVVPVPLEPRYIEYVDLKCTVDINLARFNDALLNSYRTSTMVEMT